jgi:hypothetical protein
MSALTTEDLATKPQTDVPPSRRIKSDEELAYEIQQLDDSPFRLSPAGEARRKELADELAERSMAAVVNEKKILDAVKTGGEAVEAVANEAIAHLEKYVEARKKLLELYGPYRAAWEKGVDLKLNVGPRVCIAPPQMLTNQLTRFSNLGWY